MVPEPANPESVPPVAVTIPPVNVLTASLTVNMTVADPPAVSVPPASLVMATVVGTTSVGFVP